MTEQHDETRTVIVEREFAHPPEKLWRALTQPHLLEEWLMRNDFKPEVGHAFQLRGEWGGVLDCEVLAVEPPTTVARGAVPKRTNEERHMTLNHLVRQTHRWVSVFFILAVVTATFAASTGQDTESVLYYLPLPPLFLLMLSGLYLFALPYARRRGNTANDGGM